VAWKCRVQGDLGNKHNILVRKREKKNLGEVNIYVMIKLKHMYEKHEIDSAGSGKDPMLSSCEKCNESCSPVNEAEITD
jgi:hypothetical protein